MPTLTVNAGAGSYVNKAYTKSNFSANANWFIQGGTAESLAYFYVAMPAEIRGRAILSAKLTGTASASNPSAPLTVAALASSLNTKTITWSRGRPAVRTGGKSTTIPARSNGQKFDLDVTSIVQSFANGTPNYGLRVARTSGTAQLKVRATRVGGWTLTIEFSPEAGVPSDLAPNGGLVGLAKPSVRFSFFDDGGSEFSQAHIQVSPTEDPATAFSEIVTTTEPEVDLAATAYPGATAGVETSWRVRVLESAGQWSEWSDWANFTYKPQPTIILDNPSSDAVLADSSTFIQAHSTSGPIAFWRAYIARDDDRTKILWDSGRQNGDGADFEMPIYSRPTGPASASSKPTTTALITTAPLYVAVRAWDSADRQAGGPEDPPFVEVARVVTFTPNATVAAPTFTSIESKDDKPYQVVLRWHRSSLPDSWILKRNGLATNIDIDDTPNDNGNYEWVDTGPTPNVINKYELFAVVNGKPSKAGVMSYRPRVNGIWLISPKGTVQLDGNVDNLAKTDNRITYDPPGAPAPVDVITSLNGVQGAVDADVSVATTTDIRKTLNLLSDIRDDPTERVRLIFGYSSFPALLRNLTWREQSENVPGLNDLVSVKFECWQVGEFDRRL